jgi:hypothetical protein
MFQTTDDNGLITAIWDKAGGTIHDLCRELEWLNRHLQSQLAADLIPELVERRREVLKAIAAVRQRAWARQR